MCELVRTVIDTKEVLAQGINADYLKFQATLVIEDLNVICPMIS
jgi:hypothetical protein